MKHIVKMSDIIQPCYNYIQYDKFNGFKVYKAVDTVTVLSTANAQRLQINDYGRTLNAINYAAIKYLTEKYVFIRTTFIDFRGNWATQLTDDLHVPLTLNSKPIPGGRELCVTPVALHWADDSMPVQTVYSITIGNDSYRLNNYSGWTCDPMPFIRALDEFMQCFNQYSVLGNVSSDIVLSAFTINFKVHVVAGKTYYYIDNLFMTDNNTKYTPRGNKNNFTTSNSDATSVDDLTKQRDIMYNNIYTILTQIPDVLEKDNSVNKELVSRTLYKNTLLEQYLNDANTATGYKLF